MIIGAHYDAGKPSPVTSANPSENRWKSKADNELLMDDKIDTQIIKLRTYKGFNILQFDAKKSEHMIRLACEQGAMVAPGIPASRDTCTSCTSHATLNKRTFIKVAIPTKNVQAMTEFRWSKTKVLLKLKTRKFITRPRPICYKRPGLI